MGEKPKGHLLLSIKQESVTRKKQVGHNKTKEGTFG